MKPITSSIGLVRALRPASLLLVLSACASAAWAAPIYTWDFQDASYVPGTTAAGTGVSTGGLTNGNVVSVVNSATTPVDPFGGAGNKSVYVHKASTSTDMPVFQLALPGYSTISSLASGSVSFDIYVEQLTNGRGSLEIDLGTLGAVNANSRGSSLAAFQINTSTATVPGSLSYFNNTTSGGSITTSPYVMSLNAVNNISVVWDAATKIYTISVNGTEVVSSAFTVASIAGFSSIRFTKVSDGSATDLNYFIDNVVVSAVPEPGTVSLAFLALALCGVVLLKQGAKSRQVF